MAEQESSGVPGWLNTVMKFMLRSPLHGLVSKKVMLITFTGRKSGRTYTTPVSYLQQNGTVLLFTRARWWKNLEGGAPVTLHLKGNARTGIAEAINEDKKAVAEGLTAHLRNNHFDAKYYDVTYDEQGNPNPEEIQRAVDSVVMVRVNLGA